MYSLPSRRSVPRERAAASEPASSSLSQRMVSARMKWCSRSVWMAPAASGRLRAQGNGPRAALVFACGEETDQAEQLITFADEAHQAALVQAVAGRKSAASSSSISASSASTLPQMAVAPALGAMRNFLKLVLARRPLPDPRQASSFRRCSARRGSVSARET